MNEGIDKATIKKGLKLSLIVSILALVLLFAFTINEDTINKIKKLNHFYLLLAIVVNILMWVVGGLRIKLIANALEEEISLKFAVQTFLVGAFVSNVTPFASGGGPFQVLLLHRKGISLGKSSTVIIVQFVLRLLFFSFLSPLFFFLFSDLINPGIIPSSIFNSLIIISLVISAIIVYFIWQPDKIKVIAKSLKKLNFLKVLMKSERANSLLDKLYKEMEEFHDSLWELTKYKKTSLIWAAFFTVVFWVLFFIIAPIILLGLGAKPFFVQAFVTQTIFYLILPYIPTPGGSGVAEFGFATLFSSFVPAGLIGLLAILWRFLTFYLVIIIGGIILFKMIAKSLVRL
ncbi:lysylphosphatidylglycerol synthase transmembrane domain-containing protein [Orenia marismortui]|uniref:Phosphatidylglycerol lysyltransferase n=1 Tax=Orenia marismortui TaxID=46469 RepID=A0A4R8GT62_9FIRM|nr:lysylphosphatidylglycerol synthase transmembrane domain-containing protein [Orenia marismortui]TDX49192.1 hypothetical protein C7959_11913 [Orenia marismortui]